MPSVPRLLAAVDPIQLVLRAAVGLIDGNVQGAGDGAGGVLVVPGEEHRSHPRRLHPPDGLRRLGAHHLVGQGQKAGGRSVRRQADEGAALLQPGRRPGRQLRRLGNAPLRQQGGAARQHLTAVHPGLYAPPGEHLKGF